MSQLIFTKKYLIIIIVLIFIIITTGLMFYFYKKSPKNTESIESEVIWIQSNYFKIQDTSYLDVDRNGKIFYEQSNDSKTEVKIGQISNSLTQEIFSSLDTESVINTKYEGEGELLFLDSEMISLYILKNGQVRFANAPIESFPSGFKNIYKKLKSEANEQPIVTNVKAILSGGPIESDRAEKIKNDSRKFYNFLDLDSVGLENNQSLKQAISASGRKIPVYDTTELNRIDDFISQSNLQCKNNCTEFFILFDGKYYQCQLKRL